LTAPNCGLVAGGPRFDLTGVTACLAPFTNPTDTAIIYIRELPCDPTNAGAYIYYYYSPDPLRTGATSARNYLLVSCLENTQDADRDTTSGNGADTDGFPGYCDGNAANRPTINPNTRDTSYSKREP
jgi:hypothetical protein